MVRASASCEDVYSVDATGRVILWQTTNKKGGMELSAINFIDLSVHISYFAVDTRLDQLFLGNYSNVYQMDSGISPSLPVTVRSSTNSNSEITTIYITSLDILMTGYADGDVRLFIDIHKDSVFRLPAFTNSRIMLLFPGNYSKMDKVTRKVTVMECLASIHALDEKGVLYIFDIEEKIGGPEKEVNIIPENDKGSSVVNAAYDMERSQLYVLYKTKQRGFKTIKYE